MSLSWLTTVTEFPSPVMVAPVPIREDSDCRTRGNNRALQRVCPKLDEFALSSPVWAVRTAATEEAARRIWEERPPQETDQLTSGLTLFKGEGGPADDL